MRTSLALALLLSIVSIAHADASDEARTLYQHGMALYALHRFAEAAVQFEKAFELKPDPAILYNAAQAHRFAGNKPRALDLYESYLRLYGDQPNAGEVRDHVKQLRAAIEAEHSATNAPPTAAAPLPPGSTAPSGEPPATPPSTATPPPAAATTTAGEGASSSTLTATAPPPSKPLVKKPWFWAVVGGAAVVVAAGVVLGVTLGSSAKDPTPSYGVANGN